MYKIHLRLNARLMHYIVVICNIVTSNNIKDMDKKQEEFIIIIFMSWLLQNTDDNFRTIL